MKNYSDLQAIDLKVDLELELVGDPEFALQVGPHTDYRSVYYLDLLTPFNIIIELMNKDYNANNETAVIINKLSVDNIDLIPRYDYLAEYNNDHNYHNPTSYIGFNGKWTLTIDRPFYQWLHQATAQGWLIG